MGQGAANSYIVQGRPVGIHNERVRTAGIGTVDLERPIFLCLEDVPLELVQLIAISKHWVKWGPKLKLKGDMLRPVAKD